MVFVYFLRAEITEYTPEVFFSALYLAHDMEEDYYVCTRHTKQASTY